MYVYNRRGETASNIFERLTVLLRTDNLVADISKEFAGLNDNADRVFFALELLEKYNLLPEIVLPDEGGKILNEEILNEEIHKTVHEEIPKIGDKNAIIPCATENLKINFTTLLGRHVIATENIQIGEILAVEKPFACILLPEFYQDHCHFCLKCSPKLIACNRCLLARFCDQNCMQSASNYHQVECPVLNTLVSLGFDKLKLIALRVSILALINGEDLREDLREDLIGEDEKDQKYVSRRYKEIHNLCGHTEKRSVADLFNKSVQAALIAHLIIENSAEFSKTYEKRSFFEKILRHMQTGPSNFHEISELVKGGQNENETPVNIEIGAGAYGFLSMLNHSCDPNVVRHCYGTKVVLRALRNIEKGQQLVDNYGYHYAVMNANDRRKHLLSQYFFQCNCEACLNDWPTYESLPVLPDKSLVTFEDIERLNEMDVGAVKDKLGGFFREAQNLEIGKPCRNLADFQECIKQCFSILGNKRI